MASNPPSTWALGIPVLASLALAGCGPGAFGESEGGPFDNGLLGRWNFVAMEPGPGMPLVFPNVYVDGPDGCISGYGVTLILAEDGRAAREGYARSTCAQGYNYFDLDESLAWEEVGEGAEIYIDYGSSGGEDDEGGTSGGESGLRLWLTCEREAEGLRCPSPLDGHTITLRRPACDDDDACEDGEVCFAEQCVVPMSYGG